MKQRPLISFDWAIKRMLRQKANFGILEGFLSELLKKDIKVISIPESESNAQDYSDKINKVDILCEASDNEIILIELQYNSENDYFHRMLYGTSKVITDYMDKGYTYDEVKKVISINIVYFNLGQGKDYIYHGTTEFKGMHEHDILTVSENQKSLFSVTGIKDIYPEYYILKINNFNDFAKDTLDEWIYYLKNNTLPSGYKAKGLNLVSETLKYDNMDIKSKLDYDAHQKELAITYGVIETAKYDGRIEGREEGREEGRKEGRQEAMFELAKALKMKGVTLDIISATTGLTLAEVEKL